MRRPGSQSIAVMMLVGSCVSLQFGAAMAIPLMTQLGPWLTTATRLLFASLILLAITRPAVRRWSAQQLRTVALYGLSLAGMNGFFYASIHRIPLGIAVTIEFLGPLVLAAALSRRWRDAAWVGVAAIAVGVLGLGSHGGDGARLDPLGVGFALASAVFWGLYILVGKRVASQIGGQGPLAVAMAVGALFLIPFALGDLGTFVARPDLLLPMLAVALMSSVVPYSLELQALRVLPARVFGVLLSLEPVIACIFGWLLLHQGLSPLQITAMLAVLAASVATTRT